MKKLNTRGFAHQVLILALLVVGAIGGIGSYLYLRSSDAAVSAQSKCKDQGGVWVDLRSHSIDHGPCWSTPGAYLVNWGTGKVGDGIDQVPLTGNNPETGTSKSEPFNYPNYIIIVSGKWQACGKSSCTNSLDPFTHKRSTPYRSSGGGEAYLHGGAYTLCTYSFYWYSSSGRHYAKLCSEPSIYLKRV